MHDSTVSSQFIGWVAGWLGGWAGQGCWLASGAKKKANDKSPSAVGTVQLLNFF
ncbi:MAG: hypothetical protein ACO21G_03045 [Algoriphagus sp.]